jgi:uncharacterized membrane protein
MSGISIVLWVVAGVAGVVCIVAVAFVVSYGTALVMQSAHRRAQTASDDASRGSASGFDDRNIAVAVARERYVDGDIDIDAFETAVADAYSDDFDFEDWCDRYDVNGLRAVSRHGDGELLEGETVYV